LATHRDLEGASVSGSFRQDLYERIRAFTLHLPPLRERRADLPLLSQHFVEEYNRERSGSRTIPEGALDPLFRYHWPGNIRELRQTVRRAAAFADSEAGPISVLTLLDAVQRHRASPSPAGIPFDPTTDTWKSVQDRARSLYFRSLLTETGGNKELAAKRAGVSRSQLYEILGKIEGADGEDRDGYP
jgi:DNA-binding NtrC family response regulator